MIPIDKENTTVSLEKESAEKTIERPERPQFTKRGGNSGNGRDSGSFNQQGESQNPDAQRGERPRAGAMEVTVEHNIEKAMKILKRKLIKEGLFKELKSRRYYEKPSERRKRKVKESLKKVRKDEARMKKNPFLFS